jgi:hypothetical protein
MCKERNKQEDKRGKKARETDGGVDTTIEK